MPSLYLVRTYAPPGPHTDWGYNTPEERAAAAALPGVRLLSRPQFLELLKWGVVMEVGGRTGGWLRRSRWLLVGRWVAGRVAAGLPLQSKRVDRMGGFCHWAAARGASRDRSPRQRCHWLPATTWEHLWQPQLLYDGAHAACVTRVLLPSLSSRGRSTTAASPHKRKRRRRRMPPEPQRSRPRGGF